MKGFISKINPRSVYTIALIIAFVILLVFLYRMLKNISNAATVGSWSPFGNDQAVEPPKQLPINEQNIPFSWTPTRINDAVFQLHDDYNFYSCATSNYENADLILDEILTLNQDQLKQLINDWNTRYFKEVKVVLGEDGKNLVLFDFATGGPATLSQTLTYEGCGDYTKCFSCDRYTSVIQKLKQFEGG